jgi:hypothetical protein
MLVMDKLFKVISLRINIIDYLQVLLFKFLLFILTVIDILEGENQYLIMEEIE